MTAPSNKSRSTRVSAIIGVSREAVYGAFLEPDSVESWLPPDGMKGKIHAFEPRDGGKFSMSLTYLDRSNSSGDTKGRPHGKTSEDTDTFEGRFVELRPNERIVWAVTFASDQADFADEMTITWSLADVVGGTEVTALCEGVPEGIRLEDNELGSRLSLQKLAALLERNPDR